MAKKTIKFTETQALSFSSAVASNNTMELMSIMSNPTELKAFQAWQQADLKAKENNARIDRINEIYNPQVSDNGKLFVSVDLDEVGKLSESGKSETIGYTVEGVAENMRFHVVEHEGEEYMVTFQVYKKVKK